LAVSPVSRAMAEISVCAVRLMTRRRPLEKARRGFSLAETAIGDDEQRAGRNETGGADTWNSRARA
jgi:hypothetical protein